MPVERLKASLIALVRAADPRADYRALYYGRVVAQSPDLMLVDVVPDDPKLPSMASVPLRGEAGVVSDLRSVPAGVSVLVGWENADPSKPFACLWSGADGVKKKTITADVLNLGGEEGAEPTVRGTTYRDAQSTLHGELAATLDSMSAACTGALAPLAGGFAALSASVRKFEAQQATFLSTNARVR